MFKMIEAIQSLSIIRQNIKNKISQELFKKDYDILNDSERQNVKKHLKVIKYFK